MDLESIQKFFDDRPSLTKRSISKEIGISRQYLIYILNEDRPLTDSVKEKMYPVLYKYGYRKADNTGLPQSLTRVEISQLTGYAVSSLSSKLSDAGVESVGKDINRNMLFDKDEVIDKVGFKSKNH